MIALIPFRKGSKRIRDKVVKSFNGGSLFCQAYWKASNLSSMFGKIILATDYSESFIKQELSFMDYTFYQRAEVSDTEPAAQYIGEIIKKYRLTDDEDICLLQPTGPLIEEYDITGAIQQYLKYKEKYKTLVSVTKVNPVVKLYTLIEDGGKMVSLSTNKDLVCEGHDKDYIYTRNSCIYVFNVGFFKKTGCIFEAETNYYEIPWYRSIDIDTPEDFEYAKRLVKE